jgi:hypothetical protein
LPHTSAASVTNMTTSLKLRTKQRETQTRTDVVNGGALESCIEEVELETCPVNVHDIRAHTNSDSAEEQRNETGV